MTFTTKDTAICSKTTKQTFYITQSKYRDHKYNVICRSTNCFGGRP